MPASFSSILKTGLVLTLLIGVSPVAVQAAALPPLATLQSQLQNEWVRFNQMLGPNVSTTGTVSLAKDGLNYKATLPVLNVAMNDGAVLKIENITIDVTPDASGVLNLKITTPAAINGYISTGEKVTTLNIGTQDIKATIKPINDSWQVQSLDSTLKNIDWKSKSGTALSAANIILNGKPTQTQLTTQNVSITNLDKSKQTIGNLQILQDAPGSYTMRLSDVLGLFALTAPNNSNTQNLMKSFGGSVAGATATVKNFTAYDKAGKNTVSIENLQIQNKVDGVASKMMTLKTIGSASGIKVNTAPAFAPVIPQTANFTTTIRNMPMDYFTIAQNTPEGVTKARAAKAAAGTQTQIDSLELNSANNLKATGSGLLTATNISPTYNAGTLTLNVANLSDAVAGLQATSAKSGLVNAGPSMMALMMLQGMGQTDTAKPGQTTYNVVFSPDGQILVNGQNITTLTKMFGLGSKTAPGIAPKVAPAIPTPTAPTAPAITPWKQQ